MKTLLLLVLLFFTPLFAGYTPQTDTEKSTTNFEFSSLPKILYLSYAEAPQRVIKGQIFSITIKVLSTLSNTGNITYNFTNSNGVKLLGLTPDRVKKDKYLYESFYFLVTDNDAKLPDIEASVNANYKTTTLAGYPLKVISLNRDKKFSNIIANSFELVDYKTTTFDDKHNIIIFIAKANNCDIGALKFKNVFKQGIESITDSYATSKITYFMVVEKDMEIFSFSYFNLLKNKFSKVEIPIVVEDDSVTTQSDLKPTNQSHELLKAQIATVVTLVGLFFIIWRKKYIYAILILIPLAYIRYITVPVKKVCINKGAKIHLLPMKNGTIFEATVSQIHLEKEGSVTNFVKVKLQNDKIGWVKNEDICSN